MSDHELRNKIIEQRKLDLAEEMRIQELAMEKHPGKLPLEDWLKGCDDTCSIHFGCDCGKYHTMCRNGWSQFPEGHGENLGECAYLQEAARKK